MSEMPNMFRCVCGDECILTTQGYRRASEVCKGEWVYSKCGGSVVPRQIVATESYSAPCVKISTASGTELSASRNHPILTLRGWKHAGDVISSDSLITLCSEIDNYYSIKSLDAYLLIFTLFYYSQGTSVYPVQSIPYNLEWVFCDLGMRCEIRDEEYHCEAGCDEHVRICKRYGLDITKPQSEWELPAYFNKLGMSAKNWMVQYIIEKPWTSPSNKLLQQTKLFLSTCGVCSKIVGGGLEILHDKGSFPYEDVVSVSDIGEQLVYHFQINAEEYDDQNFVANGVVCHNSNISLNPQVEIELLRNVCKKSFYRFVQEFWSTVIAETPRWNWHIEYLCQKIQEVFENVEAGRPKQHDLIVSLPPSSSKSSLLSILLPAWAWVRMPSCRFITASFSLDLSEGFARKTKNVLKSPLYKSCFGEFVFKPDQAGHYVNQYGGERIVSTTTTSPTGKHAHMILIDDPVDPLAQDRETNIYAVNTWMGRVIRSRTVDASVTPLVLIMQRLSLSDPVSNWVDKMEEIGESDKVFQVSLPASIENGQKVKPPGLRRYYQDKLFDPVRLPWSVIKDRKTWMSPADYSAQYDQNPLPREGLMFHVQKLIVRSMDELDPIVSKVRYWDKAISTQQNACFTVGALLGRTKSGKFVVMDIQRGQWDATTRENIIKNTARADGPQVVIGIEQEPGPIYEEEDVLLPSGRWRKLKDVKVGDFVANRFGEAARVTHVQEQGVLECRRLVTYGGREIVAALEHPFFTPNGTKLVKDIEKGDELLILDNFEEKVDEVCNIHEKLSMPCRCITVDEGESFVANDFQVHNSGGAESAMYSARNLAGFLVYIDKVNASKEARAEAFAIQVDNNNVFMLPGAWNANYISEMSLFPSSPRKDQVDASVGAFRMLAGTGSRTAGAL